MNYKMNLIGIFHLGGMIFLSIYGWIPFNEPSSIIDGCYLGLVVSIPASWIVCKNECVISYFVKKYKNPEYILGSEPGNTEDITELFPNKTSYDIFYHVNHILRMFSLFIVNERMEKIIPEPFFSLGLIFYTLYLYSIHYSCSPIPS